MSQKYNNALKSFIDKFNKWLKSDATTGANGHVFYRQLYVKPGKVYDKIIAYDVWDGDHRKKMGSVHGFVVKQDGTSGKFVEGDLLKPAGYNKPATNFKRGSIYSSNFNFGSHKYGISESVNAGFPDVFDAIDMKVDNPTVENVTIFLEKIRVKSKFAKSIADAYMGYKSGKVSKERAVSTLMENLSEVKHEALDLLVDILSNSMEHFSSNKDFVKDMLSLDKTLDKAGLNKIYTDYWKISPIKRMKMTTAEWQRWILQHGMKKNMNEALKPADKKVIDAFYDKKAADGKLLSTDGKVLDKSEMGGGKFAEWHNGKIRVTRKTAVRSDDDIVRYMKKSIPSGLLSETDEKGSAYDAFFKSMLKKHGVDSPDEFESDGEKKKFFDKVDAAWKADNETDVDETTASANVQGYNVPGAFSKDKKSAKEKNLTKIAHGTFAKSIDESQKVLDKIGDKLADMEERGKDNTPEYKVLSKKWKALDNKLNEALGPYYFKKQLGELKSILRGWSINFHSARSGDDGVIVEPPNSDSYMTIFINGSWEYTEHDKFSYELRVVNGHEKEMFSADNLSWGVLKQLLKKMTKKFEMNESAGCSCGCGGCDEANQLEENVYKSKIPNEWADEIEKKINAPYVETTVSTLGGEERASVMIRVSLDSKDSWNNNIYQNSRYGQFKVRYDGVLEGFSQSHNLKKKFRKTKVKTTSDVIKKINKWISDNQ